MSHAWSISFVHRVSWTVYAHAYCEVILVVSACDGCPQLPDAEHIRYVAYDFKAAARRPGAGLLSDIAPVIARCLDATGVFLCAPAPPGLAARRAGPIDWVRSA